MCCKVWEEITIPRYPNLPRYGARAGQPNTRFLDTDLFMDQGLAPYEQVLKGHTGPFIFEFQRTGIEPEEFLPRPDHFLARLSKAYAYAIEIQNPLLLRTQYPAILRSHSVSHVYDHWTYMPPLCHRWLSRTNG